MSAVSSPYLIKALRIGRIWIFSIVFAQVVLASIEAYNAINCHVLRLECWSWFVSFTLNLPFSVLIEQAFGVLPFSLTLENIYLGTGIRFLMYSVGGSLWWITLAVTVRGLWFRLRHVTNTTRMEEKNHV